MEERPKISRFSRLKNKLNNLKINKLISQNDNFDDIEKMFKSIASDLKLGLRKPKDILKGWYNFIYNDNILISFASGITYRGQNIRKNIHFVSQVPGGNIIDVGLFKRKEIMTRVKKQ